MAVTFGCPLVGTYTELANKVLKPGQRAYATDGNKWWGSIPEGQSLTKWKTGTGEKDEQGILKTFKDLPWDTNMGGDSEAPDLSNYYTKEEVDDKLEDEIFTFTCEIKENPNISGGFEVINLSATYEEVYAAYEKGKTIKVIGNTWDDRTFISDLVGFVGEFFLFSGTTDNALLTLFLDSENVEVSIRYLQIKENMIQSIERNESVDDCYPSVKAVADYVANHSGNVDLDNCYTKEEVNTLFVASDYYEARMTQTDEKIKANLQDISDLQKEFDSLLDRIIALEAKLAG